MIKRLSRYMVSHPIICCSAMHWVLTPHGMQCPQRKKTVGAVRPLERGPKGHSGKCSMRGLALASHLECIMYPLFTTLGGHCQSFLHCHLGSWTIRELIDFPGFLSVLVASSARKCQKFLQRSYFS